MSEDDHPLPDPDAATIERLAQTAVERLAAAFRAQLADVVFRTQDFADPAMLRAVGLSDPWQLIGLYQGNPLPWRSIWNSGELPSTISLFRRPLLRQQRQRGVSLDAMVNHVVVHEIGHHFGLSDSDMQRLEET